MSALPIFVVIQAVLTILLIYLLWLPVKNDIDPGEAWPFGVLVWVIAFAMIVNSFFIGIPSFTIFLIVLAIAAVIFGFLYPSIMRLFEGDKWGDPLNVQEAAEVDDIKDRQIERERELKDDLAHGLDTAKNFLGYMRSDGCGILLQFLPEHLRDDRRLVSAAIAQPDVQFTRYTRDWGNAEPVGSPLEFASIRCRQDRKLVFDAISYSADAYNHASDELRKDPDIYLTAARSLVSQTLFLTHEDNDLSLIGHVRARLGNPQLDESFYSDGVRLYKFIVGLERLITYHTGDYDDDEYGGVNNFEREGGTWEHAGDYYEEHFPTMFEDWEVVCRVLQHITTTDDPDYSWFEMYRSKWSERYKAYAPEFLFRDENGMKTDAISNRDFILYAVKKGHIHVMDCADETLKDDPVVRRALSRIRVTKDGQRQPNRPTRHT